MATRTPITVAHGDGIGPEIMAATPHILKDGALPVFLKAPINTPHETLAGETPTLRQILALADRVAALALEITTTVYLRNCDGKAGFTLAQAQ